MLSWECRFSAEAIAGSGVGIRRYALGMYDDVTRRRAKALGINPGQLRALHSLVFGVQLATALDVTVADLLDVIERRKQTA